MSYDVFLYHFISSIEICDISAAPSSAAAYTAESMVCTQSYVSNYPWNTDNNASVDDCDRRSLMFRHIGRLLFNISSTQISIDGERKRKRKGELELELFLSLR